MPKRHGDCKGGQQPKAEWQFYGRGIKIIVPPAAVTPLAAKVRRKAPFEVDFLSINADDIVSRERDTKIGEYTGGSRYFVVADVFSRALNAKGCYGSFE
jgi:hypothetical protein